MKTEIQFYPKNFYTQKSIERAIGDYIKIAKIELSENGTHYICKFSKCAVDGDRVICEFNNYLIELLNTPEEDIGR